MSQLSHFIKSTQNLSIQILNSVHKIMHKYEFSMQHQGFHSGRGFKLLA